MKPDNFIEYLTNLKQRAKDKLRLINRRKN